MLGAIIGDIIGSRFKFNNNKSKDFDLFTEDCFVTDDSIMILAIAEEVMETEKYKKTSKHGYDYSYHVLLSDLVAMRINFGRFAAHMGWDAEYLDRSETKVNPTKC
jgi:type I restriction enzyme M protein